MFWEEYGEDVILISVMVSGNGPQGTQQEIEAWTEDHDLTHPVVNDPQQTQGPYVVTGFPTYVVIDRNMTIQGDDMWPWTDSFVLQFI